MKKLIMDLDDFFKSFPHVKKSYHFLSRSWWTIIEKCYLNIDWGRITEEELIEHQDKVVSSIFDQWEEYNYVEGLSNVKFVGEEQFLPLFDYTEKVVGYLCQKIKSLIGNPDHSVYIKDIQEEFAKHSKITLIITNQT